MKKKGKRNLKIRLCSSGNQNSGVSFFLTSYLTSQSGSCIVSAQLGVFCSIRGRALNGVSRPRNNVGLVLNATKCRVGEFTNKALDARA